MPFYKSKDFYYFAKILFADMSFLCRRKNDTTNMINIPTILALVIALLSGSLFILAGIYSKFFKVNIDKRAYDQRSKSKLAVPFTISVSDYISKFELPAIIFNCKGEELLFILDSGSNGCHINSSVLRDLGVESSHVEQKEGAENYVATGNGVSAPSTEKCDLDLSLGKYNFNVPFSVEDLDAAFDYIYRTDGVRVHGILGTNFLRANNWTIDFANNMAYPAFKVKQ